MKLSFIDGTKYLLIEKLLADVSYTASLQISLTAPVIGPARTTSGRTRNPRRFRWPQMSNPTGLTPLRERLRTTVRSDLARVAVEMFLEHGFDTTTVDAIAAAAGVSRSTFFRYFPTKEDAVLAQIEARGEQFREAALVRAADEPPLLAARNALTPLIEDMGRNRERSIAVIRLIEQTPSLRARRIDKQHVLRAMLTEVMASRMATDPANDLRPALIAGVTLSMFDTAQTAWLKAGGEASLSDLVDEAFATIGREFAAVNAQA